MIFVTRRRDVIFTFNLLVSCFLDIAASWILGNWKWNDSFCNYRLVYFLRTRSKRSIIPSFLLMSMKWRFAVITSALSIISFLAKTVVFSWKIVCNNENIALKDYWEIARVKWCCLIKNNVKQLRRSNIKIKSCINVQNCFKMFRWSWEILIWTQLEYKLAEFLV